MRRLIHILLMGVLVFSSTDLMAQRKRDNRKEPSYETQRKVTEIFFEAEKQKILANLEEAGELFEQCVRLDENNDAVYYEIAGLLTELDQLQAALPFALRAYELDPTNDWYALFTADIYMGLNDYGSAARLYEKLVEKHPRNVDYLYQLATAYIYLNKLEKAIEVYDRIEEIFGVTEEISVQKEKIYLQLDKLVDAVAELEALIKNYPAEQRYLGMLAEVYKANDMTDKAMEIYQRMLENDPTDPMVHMSLADYYRQRGEYERSYEELKIAFGSPLLSIDQKIQVMMSYYQITADDDQLLDQAYELLDILVRTHPNDAKAYAMKADFLVRDNRLEEAQDVFHETVRLDSSRFLVWRELIRISYTIGDYQAMEQDSRTALELFPNQGILYLLNGIANSNLKRYQEAVKVLKQGEPFVRSNKDLYISLLGELASAYHQLNMHKESDAAFEKALSKSPNEPLLLNNYSYYLSLRGVNLDKAEAMSKKANLIEMDNPSYQDTYAWILYQKGLYDKAREWIEKALKNGGDQSGVIVEHYGDILFKLGEKEKALEQWNRALQLGDHSEELNDKINGNKEP